MQNKNKNERHWKDKLDEAGSFPYAPADKELAWQKLSGRLQEKKKRKKAVWYWAAAACLLPLLLVGVFTYMNQRDIVVKTNLLHTSTAVKLSPDKMQAPEEAIVTPSAHVKKTLAKEAKQKSTIAEANDKENDTPVDSGVMNNTAVVIVEPKDSTPAIASVVQPQKKKLRVVHINELNDPFESSPVMARNGYYPRFLPLQMARESIFPEPVKTIQSTGFISLKSRSSNQ